MKKLYVLLIAFATSSGLNAQIEGTWKLADQAGALGVGPGLGDISWWSNQTADLTTRACLFDDSVKFDASGSFFNYMDGNTWLEPWQGTDPEACGAPIAPHNGSNPATWSFNATTGELTLTGVGAHIGLAKVVNGAELGSPANAPASITYMLTLSNNNNTMTADISFGPGYWRFIYNRTNVAPPAPSNVTFKVNMANYTGTGNIANGVFLNGTFNNWNGSNIPMTNVGGTNWEVTIPLAQGPIQYKFTVDGWSDSEQLTGGDPCVDVVADGFDNRAYDVSADAVLPNVCWASCEVCPGSGINELNGADLLIVSPNPASSVFNVSFIDNLNAVEVYDLSGKLVKSVNGNTTEMNVSVESLEAGVYTVVVRTAKGDFSKKLIIE
jgi:hypothetical protein